MSEVTAISGPPHQEEVTHQYLYDEEGSLLDQFPCLQHPQIRKGCLISIGTVVVADFLTVAFHWRAICSGRLKTWLIGKYFVPLCAYLAAVFYGPCLCGLAASAPSGLYSRIENWEDSENGLHGDFGSGEPPDYSLQDIEFWRLAFQRPQETAQQVADDGRLPFPVRVWLTLIANIFDSTVLEVIWLGYGAIALSRESWVCSKQAPWLYHYTFFQVVVGCLLILFIVVWMLATFWCPAQVGMAAQRVTEKMGGMDLPIQLMSYGARGLGSGGGSAYQSESQPLVAAGGGGNVATASTSLKSSQVSPSSASTTSPASHGRSTSGSIDITVANLDGVAEEYNYHKHPNLADEVFEIGADENEDGEDGVCGMCETILNPADARAMNCGHKFHKACLNAFNLKKKCPTCRKTKKRSKAQK